MTRGYTNFTSFRFKDSEKMPGCWRATLKNIAVLLLVVALIFMVRHVVSDSVSQTSKLYNRNGKHDAELVNTGSIKNVPDIFSKLSEVNLCSLTQRFSNYFVKNAGSFWAQAQAVAGATVGHYGIQPGIYYGTPAVPPLAIIGSLSPDLKIIKTVCEQPQLQQPDAPPPRDHLDN